VRVVAKLSLRYSRGFYSLSVSIVGRRAAASDVYLCNLHDSGAAAIDAATARTQHGTYLIRTYYTLADAGLPP